MAAVAMKRRFDSDFLRTREMSVIPKPLTLAFAVTSFAQTPPAADTLVSPETHPDRTVTFRIRAPKASEIGLFGDWMPIGKLEPLTKGADGVWSITTGPIEATGHLYTFNVDGVTITDPINPKVKLRQRTSAQPARSRRARRENATEKLRVGDLPVLGDSAQLPMGAEQDLQRGPHGSKMVP